MQEIMVPCKKCGNKIAASSLKLDLDLKMVVCPDCIKNKNIHKEIEKEAFHKDNSASSQVMNQPLEEQKSAKIAHKCTSCGFKFKIDPETRIPRNCPYCNARVMGI